MNKVIALVAIALLSSCSPSRLQSYQIDEIDNQGRTIYAMDGYGDPHVTEPGSSRPHIEHALSDVCPQGVEILDLTELPAYNMSADFLYWKAKARCK